MAIIMTMEMAIETATTTLPMVVVDKQDIILNPPNSTGDAYFWTHGNTVNDLHNSGVCRYPSIGHKSNATLDNPHDVSTFGI